MILFAREGRVNGRVAWRPAIRLERAGNGHDSPAAARRSGLIPSRPITILAVVIGRAAICFYVFFAGGAVAPNER